MRGRLLAAAFAVVVGALPMQVAVADPMHPTPAEQAENAAFIKSLDDIGLVPPGQSPESLQITAIYGRGVCYRVNNGVQLEDIERYVHSVEPGLSDMAVLVFIGRAMNIWCPASNTSS